MAQLDGEQQREIFAHPHELEAPPGAICGSDQAVGPGGIGNDSGIHKTRYARPGIAMYFNTSSSRCDYGCGNVACQDLPAAPANPGLISYSSDRVGCRGLRPGTLPHHWTCGFPHPAIERSRFIPYWRQGLTEPATHIAGARHWTTPCAGWDWPRCAMPLAS